MQREDGRTILGLAGRQVDPHRLGRLVPVVRTSVWHIWHSRNVAWKLAKAGTLAFLVVCGSGWWQPAVVQVLNLSAWNQRSTPW